jgi:hypothetical protein
VCKFSETFKFPAGAEWVDGPPSKGDERGAWLYLRDSTNVEVTGGNREKDSSDSGDDNSGDEMDTA